MPTPSHDAVADARDRIDDIDRQFVQLLAERYAIVDDLCEAKEENGHTVKDCDREAKVLEQVADISDDLGLSPLFAKRLYKEILAHSVERQRQQRSDGEAAVGSDEEQWNGAAGHRSSNGRGRPSPSTTVDPVPSPATTTPERGYHEVARSSREEATRVRVGDVVVGGTAPVLIAGPCSVESSEQIRAAAEAVSTSGGQFLRGGCFKPRTSPYSFQGLGEEGLNLLAEAGQQFGLPVITEVLAPGDVDAVEARADVLQIGARNMQNYPLLKAAGRADAPVMLKRGMMASVEEWLSAAEYVVTHGNPNVILCERGIKTFESATRYTLGLSSVPVVKERSHLPVIVDPSHAAGTRRWVPSLVRAALGAGADGVMVEAHPHPDEALSDGAQSVRLSTLEEIGRCVSSWSDGG